MFQPWFTKQGRVKKKRPWRGGKVHKIHGTAPCKCKYLGDMYKIIPTPALEVVILNYCQKPFFLLVSAPIKFTEKKAAKYKMIPLSCTRALCTERSYVSRVTKRKTRYYCIIFFKTNVMIGCTL